MTFTTRSHIHLVKTALDFCDKNKIEFREFVKELVQAGPEHAFTRECTIFFPDDTSSRCRRNVIPNSLATGQPLFTPEPWTAESFFRFQWRWALEPGPKPSEARWSSDVPFVFPEGCAYSTEEIHEYLQFCYDQSEITVTPRPKDTSPEDWSTMANEIYRYKFLGNDKHRDEFIAKFNSATRLADAAEAEKNAAETKATLIKAIHESIVQKLPNIKDPGVLGELQDLLLEAFKA